MLRRSKATTRSAPPKAPAAQKAPVAKGSAKQAAYVVFASTIDLATMKKLEQHIIGIYDNEKDADVLEKKFNEANEGETDGHFTKAYTVRYVLPYTAPMVKHGLNL